MASSRDVAVFSLRKAAEALGSCDWKRHLPGWEEENEAVALRAAARAIAGDGTGPDVGTDVPMSSVGELVRYVADVLEE